MKTRAVGFAIAIAAKMRKLCGAVSRVDYFPRVLEVTVSIGQFDKSFITLAAEVSFKDLRHLFNDMLCWAFTKKEEGGKCSEEASFLTTLVRK